ncbi:MAG: mechanosensitive ion channel family protein [Paramuribaculum sp.]|nr:mechanosensitive ion channel family protein [Paramuribaculum sp.]
MLQTVREFLAQSISGPGSSVLIDAILLLGIGLAAVITFFIVKALLYLLDSAVRNTATTWDDDLLNHRLLSGVAQLAPALLINWMLPNLFDETDALNHWCRVITSFYIVWAVVHIINVTLSNLYNALARRPKLKAFAIKGVFQMGKLIAIALGAIVAISLLIGKTPLAIITTIGASAAVLMLVFRDTILGLVASVQLTANEMLHRGDWISAPKYDVNGEVIDVSLTTVKVRNWDNSVSTIPPYSLISDSFRNYQAMRDSGGRRIERSVLIDLSTVRFLTSEEVDRLAADGFVNAETAAGQHPHNNLTLLRRYLENYVTEASFVRHDMTHMIREMEPTPSGLPLQIYFFTPTTEWVAFEKVQSDFMDHVYSVVRVFGLSLFQSPAGSDIARLNQQNRSLV